MKTGGQCNWKSITPTETKMFFPQRAESSLVIAEVNGNYHRNVILTQKINNKMEKKT